MRPRQSGSTAIEFALVLLIFFTFLLAILDFSRMLFTWNAASEATRVGARYAVVCDSTANQAQVLTQMQGVLPQITSSNLNLAWTPSGCTHATCEGVTVTLNNLKYKWISPIAGLSAIPLLSMPTFKTYLPREMMRQDPNSGTIC